MGMTNREVFHATMRRENGDHLLQLKQGFNIPHGQWLAEGLPAGVADVNMGAPQLEATVLGGVEGHSSA